MLGMTRLELRVWMIWQPAMVVMGSPTVSGGVGACLGRKVENLSTTKKSIKIKQHNRSTLKFDRFSSLMIDEEIILVFYRVRRKSLKVIGEKCYCQIKNKNLLCHKDDIDKINCVQDVRNTLYYYSCTLTGGTQGRLSQPGKTGDGAALCREAHLSRVVRV